MRRYQSHGVIALVALLFVRSSGRGSAAPSEIHPIVEMGEQCLIGGVQDQKWIAASQFQKTLKSPQNFTLYTLNAPPKELVFSKNSESECHETWFAKSAPRLKDGIAIRSPSWNVIPRLPKPIDPQDPANVQIVSDILKGEGIRKPEVKITQAYTVDLDGDGNQEVVIVANRFAKGLGENSGIASQSSPGDYTLVLVRKTVGEKVQNIFLVKAVWLKEEGGALPRANHISAIADLNGDGLMEIVLFNAYYEGSGSDVVQLKGNKATGVLSCSCEH
jgi:hypothetical protein